MATWKVNCHGNICMYNNEEGKLFKNKDYEKILIETLILA